MEQMGFANGLHKRGEELRMNSQVFWPKQAGEWIIKTVKTRGEEWRVGLKER
jgi:hypothetical protein